MESISSGRKGTPSPLRERWKCISSPEGEMRIGKLASIASPLSAESFRYCFLLVFSV